MGHFASKFSLRPALESPPWISTPISIDNRVTAMQKTPSLKVSIRTVSFCNSNSDDFVKCMIYKTTLPVRKGLSGNGHITKTNVIDDNRQPGDSMLFGE